jgi:hypothetical protein
MDASGEVQSAEGRIVSEFRLDMNRKCTGLFTKLLKSERAERTATRACDCRNGEHSCATIFA